MLRFILMRLVFAIVIVILSGATDSLPAASAEPQVHIFRTHACDYCERAMTFLKLLQLEDKHFRLHDHDVDNNAKDALLFLNIVESLELQIPVIPMVFVGRVVVIGYQSDETSGRDIRKAIETCRMKGCPDLVPIFAGESEDAAAVGPAPWPVAARYTGAVRQP